MVIFIDESGTLPDIADKYIVLAALVCLNPQGLNKILPKFRRKVPLKGSRRKERRSPEFKFHYVGDITRRKVLEEIISKNVKIYILIIDKIGRKIKDTPENYGKLAKSLIVTLFEKESPKEVYLDKHFGRKIDTDKLQSILNSISSADFMTGAVLRKFRVGDESYYRIISSKIVWEKIKKWNEI